MTGNEATALIIKLAIEDLRNKPLLRQHLKINLVHLKAAETVARQLSHKPKP